MGPTWVLSAPDGPRVGPMNLAIRDCSVGGWNIDTIMVVQGLHLGTPKAELWDLLMSWISGSLNKQNWYVNICGLGLGFTFQKTAVFQDKTFFGMLEWTLCYACIPHDVIMIIHENSPEMDDTNIQTPASVHTYMTGDIETNWNKTHVYVCDIVHS